MRKTTMATKKQDPKDAAAEAAEEAEAAIEAVRDKLADPIRKDR